MKKYLFPQTFMPNPLKDKPSQPKIPNNDTTEVIKSSEEITTEWLSEGVKPDEVEKAESEKPSSKKKEIPSYSSSFC